MQLWIHHFQAQGTRFQSQGKKRTKFLISDEVLTHTQTHTHTPRYVGGILVLFGGILGDMLGLFGGIFKGILGDMLKVFGGIWGNIFGLFWC